jgi:hypothetical protein
MLSFHPSELIFHLRFERIDCSVEINKSPELVSELKQQVKRENFLEAKRLLKSENTS